MSSVAADMAAASASYQSLQRDLLSLRTQLSAISASVVVNAGKQRAQDEALHTPLLTPEVQVALSDAVAHACVAASSSSRASTMLMAAASVASGNITDGRDATPLELRTRLEAASSAASRAAELSRVYEDGLTQLQVILAYIACSPSVTPVNVDGPFSHFLHAARVTNVAVQLATTADLIATASRRRVSITGLQSQSGTPRPPPQPEPEAPVARPEPPPPATSTSTAPSAGEDTLEVHLDLTIDQLQSMTPAELSAALSLQLSVAILRLRYDGRVIMDAAQPEPGAGTTLFALGLPQQVALTVDVATQPKPGAATTSTAVPQTTSTAQEQQHTTTSTAAAPPAPVSSSAASVVSSTSATQRRLEPEPVATRPEPRMLVPRPPPPVVTAPALPREPEPVLADWATTIPAVQVVPDLNTPTVRVAAHFDSNQLASAVVGDLVDALATRLRCNVVGVTTGDGVKLYSSGPAAAAWSLRTLRDAGVGREVDLIVECDPAPAAAASPIVGMPPVHAIVVDCDWDEEQMKGTTLAMLREALCRRLGVAVLASVECEDRVLIAGAPGSAKTCPPPSTTLGKAGLRQRSSLLVRF